MIVVMRFLLFCRVSVFAAFIGVASAAAFCDEPPTYKPPDAKPDAKLDTKPDTKDYEIKLVRPPKVGMKYSITADGAVERKTSFTIAGQKAGDEETDTFGIHLEGTVEVLEVNKDGEEGKVACKVTKCTRITAAGDAELVPAGRTITAIGGKQDTTFALDQGTLSEEAKDALDLVLRMGEDDGYNDDRIYGTKQRQPVGGTWEVDAKAASDEAEADDVHFKPSDITGSLKLEKLETIDGVDCLRITGTTDIKRLTSKAPKGMTFTKGSLKAHYSGVYPLDQKTMPLVESMSVLHNAAYTGKNAGGQNVSAETTARRASEIKRKLLGESK